MEDNLGSKQCLAAAVGGIHGDLGRAAGNPVLSFPSTDTGTPNTSRGNSTHGDNAQCF